MPLDGTAAVETLVSGIQTISAFDTPAIELQEADLLHVVIEVERAGALSAAPTGLHVQNPPTLSIFVLKAHDSDIGPITLAQVGLACRSGMWPCNLLLRTVVAEPKAAEWLSSNLGDRCVLGDVSLLVRSDMVQGQVSMAGATILDAILHRPQPISPGDVAYYSNLNLAETPKGRKLVYYERGMHVTRADRGRGELRAFDAAAWGNEDLVPTITISGSAVKASITVGPVVGISSPEIPAMADFEMLASS